MAASLANLWYKIMPVLRRDFWCQSSTTNADAERLPEDLPQSMRGQCHQIRSFYWPVVPA